MSNKQRYLTQLVVTNDRWVEGLYFCGDWDASGLQIELLPFLGKRRQVVAFVKQEVKHPVRETNCFGRSRLQVGCDNPVALNLLDSPGLSTLSPASTHRLQHLPQPAVGKHFFRSSEYLRTGQRHASQRSLTALRETPGRFQVQCQGGGGSLDRWEIRMVERVVRQRWKLPPEAYDEIPVKLYAVINDTKTPQRTKISATMALLAMNAQNAETVICRMRCTPGPNQFRKSWTNSQMTPHT